MGNGNAQAVRDAIQIPEAVVPAEKVAQLYINQGFTALLPPVLSRESSCRASPPNNSYGRSKSS